MPKHGQEGERALQEPKVPSEGRRYAGEVIGGQADGGTISTADEVLQGTSTKRWFARLLPFLGPAFIACVAYVDPGNFATNISSGAQFGYNLLWVILLANIVAMLLQGLSAKLGIATGLNLPEMCRREFPRPIVMAMWIVAEIGAM